MPPSQLQMPAGNPHCPHVAAGGGGGFRRRERSQSASAVRRRRSKRMRRTRRRMAHQGTEEEAEQRTVRLSEAVQTARTVVQFVMLDPMLVVFGGKEMDR